MTDAIDKSKSLNTTIHRFFIYFDGCYGFDATVGVSSTYQMGICDIKETETGILVVLRRPGLLIGRSGIIIDELQRFLGCDVHIEEKKFYGAHY